MSLEFHAFDIAKVIEKTNQKSTSRVVFRQKSNLSDTAGWKESIETVFNNKENNTL